MCPHLLLAAALPSFLVPDPDGEGRVPFFGRTVPLFIVGRNGRVAIIGLAGEKKRRAELPSASGLLMSHTDSVLPNITFTFTVS